MDEVRNKYDFLDLAVMLSVTFLQDWERKHKQVVAIYRSHLLAAVQVS